MKQLLTFSFFAFFSTNIFSQVGKLVVNLQGLQTENGGGDVSLYIYTKENMHKVDKALRTITNNVTGSQMQVVIDSIPPGDYGVTCFQDIDRNKKLKTNFFGFPKEPIGLSNNPKVRFGPPSFKRTKITVEADKTLAITIILK